MGTIICQDCQEIIEHFEGEKVTTLYGTCSGCNQD
ncbi:GapA-binding peptide SR1P [Oceanobacillus manasiensis]|nr:GapA-binding peptide SR1P [Oceanobacillus manasiensis]